MLSIDVLSNASSESSNEFHGLRGHRLGAVASPSGSTACSSPPSSPVRVFEQECAYASATLPSHVHEGADEEVYRGAAAAVEISGRKESCFDIATQFKSFKDGVLSKQDDNNGFLKEEYFFDSAGFPSKQAVGFLGGRLWVERAVQSSLSSTVYWGWLDHMEVAVKAVNKKLLSDSSQLRKEFSILGALHAKLMQISSAAASSVVRPLTLEETSDAILLIAERLQGPDLCQFLLEKPAGRLSESEAKMVMKSLLLALGYMHKSGYVHRDVKLPNLVLRDPSDLASVALVDFGCACQTNTPYEMVRQCGSPGSCAPEVLVGKAYNSKVDIFSAGTVLYTLLSGWPPFAATSAAAILQLNCKGKLKFAERAWHDGSISALARDLTIGMTDRNVAQRLSTEEALAHRWFNS